MNIDLMGVGKAGTGRWLGLACALACASCTHQLQTASRGAAQPWAPTVQARRVENAVDAGEGNLKLQGLRRRLAANAMARAKASDSARFGMIDRRAQIACSMLRCRRTDARKIMVAVSIVWTRYT